MGVGSSELEPEQPPVEPPGAAEAGGAAATSAQRRSHAGQELPAQREPLPFGEGDGSSPAASTRYFQLLHSDEQRAREDFMRLWEQYVPGGTRTLTVSRPLMREVLLRAARKLGLSPQRAARADDLVALALGPAPPALAVEDAFKIFRSVISELQAARPEEREAPRWELGERGGLAGPREAASMPKGARMVDAAPRKKNSAGAAPKAPRVVRDPATAAALGMSVSNLDTTAPMRPTRAALESMNANLRAALGASQAAYEKLVLKAESLQIALARGAASAQGSGGAAGAGASSGAGEFAELHRGLNLKRVHAVSLEAELDRCLDRLRFSSGVKERQHREIAGLREDCRLQAQRAQAARQQREETREKLQQAGQESAELARKAQTEQLRAVMLREAFEQEQTRVGVSLGRAEAFVCDLVAATEGTRRVEVEEQSLARECVSALSELQTAQAHDELETEARLVQLRRELEALKASTPPPDDAAAIRATAAYAKLESERHAATMELGEVRRRFHGVAAITRRRAADVSVFQRELDVLREKSQKVAAELSSSLNRDEAPERQRLANSHLAMLRPRLRLEEAAESALRAAEARVAGELADAQQRGEAFGGASPAGAAGGRARCSASGELAQSCAERLAGELEEVRAELSDAGAAAALRPRAPSSAEPEAPLVNLQAAALQRKVGLALAAEREHQCRLQEKLLEERFSWEANQALQGQIAVLAHNEASRPSAAWSPSSLWALAGKPSSPAARVREAQLELQIKRQTGELQRCATALKQAQEALQTLPSESQALEESARFGLPTAADGGADSVSAAVAAADLLAAPAVAAAKFQARLAALRGEIGAPSTAAPNASPSSGHRQPQDEDGTSDLRQLQRHLRQLRSELTQDSGQKPGAELAAEAEAARRQRLAALGLGGSAVLSGGSAAVQAARMAPAA